jgi:hypothetical protein
MADPAACSANHPEAPKIHQRAAFETADPEFVPAGGP